MSAALVAFLNNFTDADLKEVFPDGNKTAAAAYARYRVYIGDATTPKKMIEDIMRVRHDAEFAPGVGHKRGGLIVAIAVCVKALSVKGTRELTDKMKKMIDESFDEQFIDDFVRLITGENKAVLVWSKDGAPRKIKVCLEASTDAALVSWASIAWAPIRA